MRKFMVLPMAGLLALSVAGPVSAGPNVSNTRGSGESIYGEWYGARTYGYVFLGEDSVYGSFGDIYQETGEWVVCDPAAGGAPGGAPGPAPYDTTPGGETYGFVGTRTWGHSDSIGIDLSRRLETGSATGQVELNTATVDECAGNFGDNAVSEVGAISVSLTGVGPLATFRGHGSYKVPSQFNGHSNYRGKERAASGSVVAGSSIDATFTNADMSVLTWSDHAN